jgi:hypothetical protein
MTFRWGMIGVAASAALAVAAPAAASTTVYANNGAPGDSYTNAGGSNQGQAVGASGWYYNNVRNSGAVGISTASPRSGNGSVAFGSPTGAAKADIEFLAGGTNAAGNFYATGTLGTLSEFEGFSYDWLRVGTSTNPAAQHPAFRILLDRDGNLGTVGDRGGIVFERAYNSLATPTDQWMTDAFSANTRLWNFGLGLGFEFDIDGDNTPYDTLAEWQAGLPNAVILGFSVGVGSGWNGAFTGYADNISWTIDGVTTTTNFEVAGIPEPGAWCLMILGFGLAGGALRRRSAALSA